MRDPLPIDDVLDDLTARLLARPNHVVIAPPGSGKTTRVAPALLDRGVVGARDGVLILEPRRLAARLSAERVAVERGARLGDEVGYQIRFENKTSPSTRIAFLTEGILAKRLATDPGLDGVGAVILDEFHERSIHADLALALLKEVQSTVRPDLRILIMSATLDPGPVAEFLGGAETTVAEGRIFPVEVRWLDRPDERPLPELVAASVRRAMREHCDGDVLAFLPGAPEIHRTAERLSDLDGHGVDVLPLYGELSAKDQDRAVRPGPRRKLILSTNIAESSLTIPCVSIVIDAGWAKVARYDPSIGMDRLELTRIARQSAEQRTGRAGRTRSGVAYRLWTKSEDHRLRPSEDPEILRVDLAPTLLEVLRWSARDPRTFDWFEAPTVPIVERALALLEALGAVDRARFALTPLGQRLAAFPIHPRLGALLIAAHGRGRASRGALLAAIASEREVIRSARLEDTVRSSDLIFRADLVEEFERSSGTPRAADRLGLHFATASRILRIRDQLMGASTQVLKDAPPLFSGTSIDPEEDELYAIYVAYADRVGRRRKGEDKVTLVGGGEPRLARTSLVKEGELLVAVNVDGGDRHVPSRGGLVRWASQIDRGWLPTTRVIAHRFQRDRDAVEAVEEVRLGELLLEVRPAPPGSDVDLGSALAEAARADLERALPITSALEELLHRYAFVRRHRPDLGWPPIDPSFRLEILDELCAGQRSFRELRAIPLADEFRARMLPEVRRSLDALAPERIEVPSGRSARLRYDSDGPPTLSIRLQEVFGLLDTPRVLGGRVPIRVELLSPSHRPVQVTQDLKSFWDTTYAEVRKELRRRYPKHQWPEDPRLGVPTARVRPPAKSSTKPTRGSPKKG